MSHPIGTYVHGTLSALAVIATVLPIFRTTSKWFRFFDFPRAQIAVFLAILLVTAWWVWANHEQLFVILGLLAACLLFQVYWIFPFTPVARKEVQLSVKGNADRTVSLMIYNVRMENHEYKPMLERVRETDPDMILANEVNEWWIAKLDPLKKTYPYQVLRPQENTYGMALYSRLELANVKVLEQVEKDIPSIHCKVTLRDGSSFDFHGLHPQPPDLKNDTEDRDAELVKTGIKIKKAAKPALVAGDLNDVAWSRTTRLFKRLSGMLDPRTGRGFYNTYNVFLPFFRYPLDHLFITRHFQLVELKRLPACGSDHFPMLARLEYVPEEKHEQPVQKADSTDKDHAKEILEEAEKK